MKYKWKTYPMGGVDAQVAGEEIARLEAEYEGALLPATIVKAAKPKRSPIHNCFEWDDKKAADTYRLRQASEMMRKLVVVYEDKGGEEEVRAFVSIRTPEDAYYTSISRLVDNEELLENVRDQIVEDLLAVKKKYAQFKDDKLSKIWAAVEEFAVR